MPNTGLTYEDMGFASWNVSWWDVGLRALIAILFGFALLFWPGLSLLTFVYLLAAFLFFDGVLVLLQMVSVKDGRWFWRLLHGLISIAVAAIIVLIPGKTVMFLGIMLGAYWIMAGILEVLLAVDLRKAIKGELLLVAVGVLSVIAGAILIFRPFTGLIALAQVIGILNIALGIILALLAVKLALASSRKPAPA
ncbi:HdeD family acid-resistance protein [Methanocella arvoryzae]|uniref:HdeD family acid-resistance protein n=1 Tax=Methanocella arvoryzae (strain DSM 22066 / NBRC 105507 / MRE50) TaxID=351160 RepID=Q0W109_METAR|nr:DUF308 domain-containing protein [Methanocella arvoryzae]CAJ37934.1 conserved hypothetical protein [Methanocella arvoryzae MRE50]